MIGNKIPEENKVINPVLGRAKFFRREDGRHAISNSAKHPTRTSSTKWGVMVDVKEIIPVDHKASLLWWYYGTMSKGKVNVEGSCLGVGGGELRTRVLISLKVPQSQVSRVESIPSLTEGREGLFLEKKRSWMTLHSVVDPTLGMVPSGEVPKGLIKYSKCEHEKGLE